MSSIRHELVGTSESARFLLFDAFSNELVTGCQCFVYSGENYDKPQRVTDVYLVIVDQNMEKIFFPKKFLRGAKLFTS